MTYCVLQSILYAKRNFKNRQHCLTFFHSHGTLPTFLTVFLYFRCCCCRRVFFFFFLLPGMRSFGITMILTYTKATVIHRLNYTTPNKKEKQNSVSRLCTYYMHTRPYPPPAPIPPSPPVYSLFISIPPLPAFASFFIRKENMICASGTIFTSYKF